MRNKYGISEILSIDLHDNNTHGITNIGMSEFWNDIVSNSSVMIAPDNGASVRDDYVYDFVLSKTRMGNRVRINNQGELLLGDRLFIVDDIIDSGATAIAASKFMRDCYGCDRITLCATHGVFAIRKQGIADSLQSLPFVSQIYITDSVINTDYLELVPKCSAISCADYIGAKLTQILEVW
jgi:phosphoribosylpyrophosphate synthetase